MNPLAREFALAFAASRPSGIVPGGGRGGQQGIDDAALPQRHYIDYVHGYEAAHGKTGQGATKR